MPIELKDIFKNEVPVDTSLDDAGFRIVFEDDQIKKIAKTNDNSGGVKDLTSNISFTIPGGTGTWGGITGTLSSQMDLQNALNAKQDALVSGVSLKTVNGNSLLGGGNILIEDGANWRHIVRYNQLKF